MVFEFKTKSSSLQGLHNFCGEHSNVIVCGSRHRKCRKIFGEICCPCPWKMKLKYLDLPRKRKIGVKHFWARNLKAKRNAENFGREFLGGNFVGGPEALEKQGRKIRLKSALQNLGIKKCPELITKDFTPQFSSDNLQLLHLVARTHAVTPIALHNVAADSHSFRDVAGMSRYTLQKTVSHLFPTPPIVIMFGVFWREKNRRKIGGGEVSHWKCQRRRGNISLPKTDCAKQGCRSYTHTNRATLCH